MIYNTKKVTNITDKTFTGRYSGIDFEFKPKQTRYLPTFIAEHLAEQLLREILRKAKVDKEENPAIDGIIGSEIQTKDDINGLSYKEIVERHEKEFAEKEENAKKEKLLQKEEALNVAKNV